MGLYNTMKTSPKLESEGIWLSVDDTRIRLARAGGKNTKFLTAAEKLAREHKRAIDLMGEAQGRKLFAKLYAEIIVLDWLTKSPDGKMDETADPVDDTWKGDRFVRGISGPDGSILEFTVENVLKVFDDLPDLLLMIKATAEDASLFREELIKDIQGN